MREESDRLREHFLTLRDEDLVRIVHVEREQYEDVAIEIAKNVLSQRGVSDERVDEIKRAIERELDEDAERMGGAGSSKWVKVRILPSRLYGEQMRDILMHEGIPSVLKGEDLGVFGPGAGYGTSLLGVTLWVPGEFQERARELVEAYFDGL